MKVKDKANLSTNTIQNTKFDWPTAITVYINIYYPLLN